MNDQQGCGVGSRASTFVTVFALLGCVAGCGAAGEATGDGDHAEPLDLRRPALDAGVRPPSIDAGESAPRLPRGTAPLYVLGDLDEDGAVDARDQAALAGLVRGVGSASCAAAGDLNLDGHLDTIDMERMGDMLRRGVTAPALHGVSPLPCSRRGAFLASSAQLHPGAVTTLFALRPELLRGVTLRSGAARLIARGDRGADLAVGDDAADGSPVLITTTLANGRRYLLTLVVNRPHTSNDAVRERPSAPSAPPTPPAACPQRTRGCAALILDFSRNTTARYGIHETDLSTLGARLRRLGCDVFDPAPAFVPIPVPYAIETPRGTWSYAADVAQVTRAVATNDAEWRRVDAERARFRARVWLGVETAMTFLNGHGTPRGGADCGGLQPMFDTVTPFGRSELYAGIYNDVRPNACAWLVSDMSCQSGLTPMAIEEINNNGATPACVGGAPALCTMHAGYEADVAAGSAGPINACLDDDVATRVRYLNDALVREEQLRTTLRPDEQGRHLVETLRATLRQVSPAFYADRGRAGDNPPVHAHVGF